MTMCLPIPKDMEANFDFSTSSLMRNGNHARYIGKKEDIISEIEKSGLEIVEYNYSDSDGNGYLTAITRIKK